MSGPDVLMIHEWDVGPAIECEETNMKLSLRSFAVKPRRRGFTLIELLVVIGIIAVLIGGCFCRALNRGRRRIQRQHRRVRVEPAWQIGLAAAMYSQMFDNSRRCLCSFGPIGFDQGVPGNSYKTFDEWYVGLVALKLLNKPAISVADNTAGNAIFDYNSVFVCPDTPGVYRECSPALASHWTGRLQPARWPIHCQSIFLLSIPLPDSFLSPAYAVCCSYAMNADNFATQLSPMEVGLRCGQIFRSSLRPQWGTSYSGLL